MDEQNLCRRSLSWNLVSMYACEQCGARYSSDVDQCPVDGGTLLQLVDPILGRSLAGRYVIAEKIGAGGMGTVYRAFHEVLQRDVAVKFLSPQLAHDPANRTRFLREARAANRINHEHIIDITDFGETPDGLVYLVMEYLNGMPLSKAIDRGIPIQEGAQVAAQCARALARAHELGVIHRDIKPDNIFLLHGYENIFVKLLDFGLAKMKGELRVTATGTVFGTPEYIAPEQARGMNVTSKVDIYSLGCVVYEMVTGHLPFSGTTPELVLGHLRETPKNPKYYVRDLAEPFAGFILRMMEKNPAARPDAHEVADALKVFSGPASTMVEPAPPEIRQPVPESLETEPPGQNVPQSLGNTLEHWGREIASLDEALTGVELPEPMVEHLGRLIRLHQEVTELNDEMILASKEAAVAEESGRCERMRLGTAIDQVASKLADKKRERDQAIASLTQAASRLRDLQDELQRVWAEVREAARISSPDPSPTQEELHTLADAAMVAKIAIESQEAIATSESRAGDLEIEISDLDFQLSTLRGRVNAASAGTTHDLDSLRKSATRIQAEIDPRMRLIAESARALRRFASAALDETIRA